MHGLPFPSDSPPARARRLVPALFDDAATVDGRGEFPVRSLDALRAAGLLAAPVAVARGGEGLGERAALGALLHTLAAIGRGSLVVGRIYEGHVNALQLVDRYGTPAQRARAAADACAGKLFGVWNTEGADGVAFEAGPGDRRRLRGAKTFATGAGHVERALVTGRLPDGGWQMALLRLDEAPPRIDDRFWRPLGMRATASHRADLGHLEAGAADLVGGPGDYYRQPLFGGGAIRFAAVQVGGIETLFDETRRFLRDLGRADDPHQRARVGEMAWLVESARLWLDGAARHAALAVPSSAASIESDEEASACVAYAHCMRSAIESIGVRTIELADRSVGARGLLQPEPFERLHRDLAHYLRQPAPDAALVDAGRHALDVRRDAASLWPAS